MNDMPFISVIKNNAKPLLCVIFIIIGFYVNSQDTYQDQVSVDSLKQVYNEDTTISNNLRILAVIINNETDPKEKLHYSDLLIKTVTETKRDSASYYLSLGYLEKGNALLLQGDFHEALEAYFKSSDWAKKDKDEALSARLMASIADTYSMMGNSDNAKLYYDESIVLLRKLKDSVGLATALLNAGDEYYKTEQYDKALSNFAESGDIFNRLDYQVGQAYNIGNIGMVYAKQGKDELAKINMNEAIALLEDNEDYYPISEFLSFISDLYSEQQNHTLALEYAERSLKLAKDYHLKNQISDANLQLSKLSESAGKAEQALNYYKEHIIFRDSVINLERQEKMFNQEVYQNKLEVENLEQKRKTQRIILWSTVGVLVLIILLARGLYKTNKFVKATNKTIALEMQRSDDLLRNILPEETAQELKDYGKVKAKKYPSVTVLFSDFKGFTSYAENLSPEALVETIDHYFSEFDIIMEKYGLEKIKTIGDAYMAVGGLSFDTNDQAKAMVLAAIEMNNFVTQTKLDDATTATFDIRIGINTGPVVAGVVGTKKFAYDIWGDTVNIASRMESNSEPGRINISENTYQIIKSDFECEYRGRLAVKNRGQMNMYFVNS